MRTYFSGSALFISVLAGLMMCLLSACKKKETEGTFFLTANPVSVKPQSGQGTSSHKITDIWLYVNGNFRAFTLAVI